MLSSARSSFSLLRPERSWQVLTAGICALVLTVGLSRFAYTPLLPLMLAHAGLSDAMGGWLATINYVGYISGMIIAATISSPRLRWRCYCAGLIAGVVGTAGMGLTTNLYIWMVLRYVAGCSAAAGMMLASGMVFAWLAAQGRRLELGVHFIGLGLGIAVSGVLVAAMSGTLGWAQQWQVMGVIGLILLVPAWFWMPVLETPARSAAASTGRVGQPAASPKPRGAWLLIMAYFCAGVGYVVSATFVVVVTEREPGLGGIGTLVWIVAGAAAIPACLVWDRLARWIGDVRTLLIAYAAQVVSIVLPMVSTGFVAALIGAFLFGATFIGIVALTLTLAGRQNPVHPSQAMARLSLSYSLAQIIAPAVVGTLAERTGSYTPGLIMASVTMVVGMGFLAALEMRGRAVGVA